MAVSKEKRTKASLNFQIQWEKTRREGELVPPRSKFDPIDFPDILPSFILAEVDPVSQTMPIRLAGSAIRDFVGFELTGVNYLDYVEKTNETAEWLYRLALHDHPCGRFETVEISFTGDLSIACSLTTFPLVGSGGERLILTFAEPIESQLLPNRGQIANFTEHAVSIDFIDIGAGVPDFTASSSA